ncbi:MAG: hypothetical protein IKL53_12185 [Lachnospiraceae bacterium]|nr:hypothetical protein [Lachnospiraceae bacterium]
MSDELNTRMKEVKNESEETPLTPFKRLVNDKTVLIALGVMVVVWLFVTCMILSMVTDVDDRLKNIEEKYEEEENSSEYESSINFTVNNKVTGYIDCVRVQNSTYSVVVGGDKYYIDEEQYNELKECVGQLIELEHVYINVGSYSYYDVTYRFIPVG